MGTRERGEQLDPEGLSWSVPCHTSPTDSEDGEEDVRVLVLGDRIGLVLPPGETLVLTPEEAEEFSELLDTASASSGS
ncbi:hypothetical protein [Actinopolyspora mortivallis]|uniref:hypothetical protein n=1 Tax=Actinopolyspora mortivallis TaxID=33906 RepID=UPI0011B271A0|nr:hypothetical protein [Actinopolyspora mortivallis]